jgi:hypothetical protein
MKNLKYLKAFEWSGETFKDRVGEPDAFEAAVGKIAMNFADLEHTANRLVRDIAQLEPGRPTINPSSMSFIQKINVLASTVSRLKDLVPFNTGDAQTQEFFDELKRLCVEADVLYREVMGARWGCRNKSGGIEVLKPVDLAGDSSENRVAVLDAHKLLDIADFICLVEDELEQFFLDPGILVPESA